MNTDCLDIAVAAGPWCAQTGEDIFREVSRAVAERDPTPNTGLLVGLMAGLGLVLALAGLWRARGARAQSQESSAVFEGLASRLGLEGADRSLVRRVSQAAGLPSPLALLLVESVFDSHVGPFIAQAPRWCKGRWSRRLASVRARAFVSEGGAAKPGAGD